MERRCPDVPVTYFSIITCTIKLALCQSFASAVKLFPWLMLCGRERERELSLYLYNGMYEVEAEAEAVAGACPRQTNKYRHTRVSIWNCTSHSLTHSLSLTPVVLEIWGEILVQIKAFVFISILLLRVLGNIIFIRSHTNRFLNFFYKPI